MAEGLFPLSDESPAVDAARTADVRLCLVDGVGPKLRRALLDRFGTAAEIFDAAPSSIRDVPGIGPKIGRALAAAAALDVTGMIAGWQGQGVELLIEGDADYPEPLTEIPDPPGLLFRRGSLLPRDRMAVAIVGTRHCSHYGMRMAERLASGLAKEGYTIVSGLARGIDAAAHEAALKAGGRTIAVLGSGVVSVYPSEHKALAARVVAGGALLSETPPEDSPEKGAFPRRNRIISGLTLGTLVIEAGLKSGSLITARHAMEQGREVFAVPGHADEETARGCHRLIRDGAKLVETIDDVLEELGPLMTPTPTDDGTMIRNPLELTLNEVERAVLDLIRTDATGVDGIIVASGLPPQQVLATLSVLEMKRLVRRLSGQLVQRR